MCFTLTISFARALSGVKVDDNHDLIEENQAEQTYEFVMAVNTFTHMQSSRQRLKQKKSIETLIEREGRKSARKKTATINE